MSSSFPTTFTHSAESDPTISRALEIFKSTTKTDPSNYDAYFQLGLILYTNFYIEDAHHTFSQAVKLNPDSAEAYFYLGETFNEISQYDESY